MNILRFIASGSICLFPLSLQGAGEGFTVIAGEASPPVEQEAGHFVIESGERTIVEWKSFSIAPHESFHFQQFDSQSALLNRVVGGPLTEIFGSLTSNGTVFLINPSGILIGKGGRIETAHFIASGLDLSNAEFLQKGPLTFLGNGNVVQQGKIVCPTGSVTLIGRRVVQEGEVSAKSVSLLSASSVLLQPDKHPEVLVLPGEGGWETPYAAAIGREGLIEADEIIVAVAGGALEIREKGELPVQEWLERGSSVHLQGKRISLLSPLSWAGEASLSLEGSAEVRLASPLKAGGDLSFVGRGEGEGIFHGVAIQAPIQGAKNLFLSGRGGPLGGRGISLEAKVEVQGALLFQQCEGGRSGPNNYGVYISAPLVAREILGRNLLSGRGAQGNIAFYNHEAKIGGPACERIDLVGMSQGVGSSEHGIYSSGRLEADRIFLQGTGGGLSDGGNSFGIFLQQAELFGREEISLSGSGGRGRGGFHYGIQMTSSHLFLEGAGAITLSHCSGGMGGNFNAGGALFYSTLEAPNGAIHLSAISGGGGETARENYGLQLFHTSLQGKQIIAEKIEGGAGKNNNYGLYLESGVSIGSLEREGEIFLEAKSCGVGTNEVGIFIDAGNHLAVQGGKITLEGRGGRGVLENFGIGMTGMSQIESAGGSISLKGEGGEGLSPYAIALDGRCHLYSSKAGAIELSSLNDKPIALGVVMILSEEGPVALRGPVTLLATSPAISGRGLLFQGTIDGAFPLNASSGGGVLELGGAVGSKIPLLELNLTGASFAVGGDVTTKGPKGSIVLESPATLLAPATLHASGKLSLEKGIQGPHPLTLETEGEGLSLKGPTHVESLTLRGGPISLSGDIRIGSGELLLLNPVIPGTSFSLSGGKKGLFFSQPLLQGEDLSIASEGELFLPPHLSARNLSLRGSIPLFSDLHLQAEERLSLVGDLHGPHALTLEGTRCHIEGALSSIERLSLSSSQGAEWGMTGDVVEGLEVEGPLLFTKEIHLTSHQGDLSFRGTVDGLAPLTLSAPQGALSFEGPLGAHHPPEALHLTAQTIELKGGQTVAHEARYRAPVVGSGPLTLSAEHLLFEREVSIEGPLSLEGERRIEVAGDLSASSLRALSQGEILFHGKISTEGRGEGKGGDVLIASQGGSVLVHEINTSGGTGEMQGGDAGAIALQPSFELIHDELLGPLPKGRLILGGPLVARGGKGEVKGRGGEIYLSPAERCSAPSVATIVSTLPGNDVKIVGKNLTVGANESITIFGSLSGEFEESIRVPDIIVLDELQLSAPLITSVGKRDSYFLDPSGMIYAAERGGHFLARTKLAISAPQGEPMIGFLEPSREVLQRKLLYGEDLLLTYSPTPPATPDPFLTSAQILQLLSVATISFEDLLPFWPRFEMWRYLPWVIYHRWSPLRAIPPSKGGERLLFDAFIPENRVD